MLTAAPGAAGDATVSGGGQSVDGMRPALAPLPAGEVAQRERRHGEGGHGEGGHGEGGQSASGHLGRLKWLYLRELLRGGYHVVFSDAEVSWLADPLAHWDRSYDLQAAIV